MYQNSEESCICSVQSANNIDGQDTNTPSIKMLLYYKLLGATKNSRNRGTKLRSQYLSVTQAKFKKNIIYMMHVKSHREMKLMSMGDL